MMSSPYSQSYQVFASGTKATANATFSPGNIGAGDIKFGGSVAFQYVGAAFSGTFDFQGRPHASASWVNLPYIVMAAAPAVSVAQVSHTTDSSTITYVVLMPMEEMRVVMTRSAGTFGMWAHSFEQVLGSIVSGVTPGTGATNLGKAEDAAHTSGDVGVMALGVWNPDGATSLGGTGGDYTPFATDIKGRMLVSGQRPHDATLGSNDEKPVVTGGYASTAVPTAVSADGDAVWAWLDRNGRAIVRQMLDDGSGNFSTPLSQNSIGDAVGSASGFPTTTLYGYNGSTFDRLRTRGTGILQVEQAYSFLNVAAGQATTTVKSGAGTLHTLVLNSAATATNTTTIYDNTAASGTVIAIPAVTTATVPVSLLFDLSFGTGLTVITATANGGNMTFTYR